ncbi:MAG: Tol biopolymer transport system component [Saprospiraceae bacterium]|jgi:Tol biopolymer transport system component|tara:strand:- start:37 stop:1017 length:981 start_codon:yes stop_codon:yes gene_type:complete
MMNRSLFLFGIAILLAISSCKTSYLMIAEGESFDALTKITDDKKVCLLPNGGDNGKNLVFSSLEEDGSYNIYLKDNVLSNALIQKTQGSNFNVFPSYCSANEKIAFQYWTRTNFDIYYINASSGKAITQITSTDENEFNPSWSNDGTMIVFERGSTPKSYINYKTGGYVSGIKVTENQIWIKNIETGELKMVGQGSYPKFSPDDKEIVFVKYDLNRKKTAETGTIRIMSVNGDNEKQITGINTGYATCPNWGPNGKNIVFQLTKKDKTDSDIYTIGVNGDDLKQHTSNKSQDFAPYWTSDNYIFFSSDRSSKSGEYIIWRFKINID